eukprot:m.193855 g.193855  ORF g.193855 m.193855 type:complete len:54 (-) comp19056_c0_seq1:139-300(-)
MAEAQVASEVYILQWTDVVLIGLMVATMCIIASKVLGTGSLGTRKPDGKSKSE